MYEAHVGGWEVALVLFIIGYILYRMDKVKVAKILHMILRLMYIIIIVAGAGMLVMTDFADWTLLVKGILGIVAIGLIEMAMVRASKRVPSTGFFIGALVLFVLVILIGYGVILR